MSKVKSLLVEHDVATDTYTLLNVETGQSLTLPKKMTIELHKVVRGK